MVRRPDGSLRVPSLTERERLMGFDEGYISNAISPKLTVDEAFIVGASMIGNSFHVHATTLLFDELLAQVCPGYVPRQLDRILSCGPTAPLGWCVRPHFVAGTKPDRRSQMLVQEFLRIADRGGSDVRLDVGIPYRIKAWPRAGLRTHLFYWRIIHGYPWKHSAHINVLELQAVVNAVQWRLRTSSNCSQRVLRLVDSQVVAAIIAKGRTSSARLLPALAKLNSLCVIAGIYLSIGYIDTNDNPSDVPSRWAQMNVSVSRGKRNAKAKL